MGLNAYIQGFNSLESIDRAPGYFKWGVAYLTGVLISPMKRSV